MKRYAIVRVDNKCPDEFENIKIDYICRNISCYQGKECSKKFYGDTKEQLIRKVAQVLIKDENKYCQPKTEVHKRISWQNNMELAKQIVEFLGVEE